MKDKIIFSHTPAGRNIFYEMFMDAEKWNSPTWIGVDWCAGNGFIRGEVFERRGNVIYVRFKTVTFEN